MIRLLYQLAMQNKRSAVHVATVLDSRTWTSEVRASKVIPHQTADFIQDPHPRA